LESDLFIYCGHGAGEKYFHRDQILKLKGSSCSAAFLFGCSSGRLEKEGIFGPNGTVMSYLTAGSPAILAMLWDVTDRDVDRLSMRILEDWVLSEEEKNDICLGEMLQQSRSVCKLKNLNGLAAVCYGIPVRMTS
jgi:separase